MRRTLLTCLGCLLLLLAAPAAPAAAQEVQVPLDEAGRVTTVDARLARQLGLWVDEFPGFQEARLFETPAGALVLEITALRGGRLVRERVPLTPADAERIRRLVGAATAAGGPGPRGEGPNQEGRYLLLTQTTLAGLGFYGWAVPYALRADDSGAGGLYLLTAGASFFLPFALSEGEPVTFGMANLSRYGVTRGISHGLLLYNLFAGEEERVDCVPDAPCTYPDTESDDRNRVGMGLLASLAEGAAGYFWARNEGLSAGAVNTISLGGDAGLLWGLGTAYVLGADDIGERATAAITLPFAAAGLYAGHKLAHRRDYTWGDADVLYTAGAVGAYAGFALGSLLPDAEEELDDDARIEVGLAMLGGAAGLVAADRLVRGTDFTVGQSTLNRLGALAGALAGASVGVMAEDEDVLLIGSALGAAAGFATTYASLAPRARQQRGERMSGSWDVRLSPQAFSGARLSVRYRF